MASNFGEKYRDFMSHRNGPDQLSRDALVLALAIIIISVFLHDGARTVLLLVGLAVAAYSYFRMFSSKVDARSKENEAYLEKRRQVLGKLGGLGRGGAGASNTGKGGTSGNGGSGSGSVGSFFQKLRNQGAQAASRANRAAAHAKDREHRYFSCPKCGQQVRVPKGAGKIRVTCPKCGEKFERKA